jgi:hypothetical protein
MCILLVLSYIIIKQCTDINNIKYETTRLSLIDPCPYKETSVSETTSLIMET